MGTDHYDQIPDTPPLYQNVMTSPDIHQEFDNDHYDQPESIQDAFDEAESIPASDVPAQTTTEVHQYLEILDSASDQNDESSSDQRQEESTHDEAADADDNDDQSASSQYDRLDLIAVSTETPPTPSVYARLTR